MRNILSTAIVLNHYALLCTILLHSIQPSNSSAAGQEMLIGITGRDFIMLGADSSLASSITVTTSNVDKLNVLVDPFPNRHRRGIQNRSGDEQQVIVVASAGDAADGERLLGLLRAHTSVAEFETSVGCDVKCLYHGDAHADGHTHADGSGDGDTHHRWISDASPSSSGLEADAVARLARGEIASSLRSNGRYNACLLVAGMVTCPEPSAAGAARSTYLPTHDESQASSFSRRIRHQVEAGRKVYAAGSDGHDDGTGGDTSSATLHRRYEAKELAETTVLRNLTDGSKALQPRLYWLDEYGSIQTLEYGAHGLGANFALSILDRGYNPDLSREEAVTLIQNCFQQLKTRFIINSPTPPCVKCIDKDGCHLVSGGNNSPQI